MSMLSGTHSRAVTRTAGAAIIKGQPLKAGANPGEVVPCATATDVAIGVAGDDAEKGAVVPLCLLGGAGQTVLVLSGGAIAVGDAVGVTGAAVTTGLHIGRALEAAVSGELFECDPATCQTV